MPSDNAEARVERALGHLRAIRHGDLDLEIGVLARDLANGLGDHFSRHRIDGRFARRDRQAGARDQADALASRVGDARAGFAGPDSRGDHRAVGDVGIVAGILDDGRSRGAVAKIGTGEREGDAAARRQRDFDRIGEIAMKQRSRRRLGGRGRAGASGPAALEGPILGSIFFHRPIYRTGPVARHGGKPHA